MFGLPGAPSSNRARPRPMSRILTVGLQRACRVALGPRRHQHQVGRLQVAVDHALLVEVLQAEQRLVDEADRLGRRQLAAPLQHLLERLAVEVLHDEVVQPVGLADLEGADDVGVLELHGQPGLALEAAERFRVLGLGRRQHLDGDDLAELVDRLVDAGHAALADAVEDLVVVEEEVVGLAAQQQVRLVLGEVLVGDQPACEPRRWRRGPSPRPSTVGAGCGPPLGGSSRLRTSKLQQASTDDSMNHSCRPRQGPGHARCVTIPLGLPRTPGRIDSAGNEKDRSGESMVRVTGAGVPVSAASSPGRGSLVT